MSTYGIPAELAGADTAPVPAIEAPEQAPQQVITEERVIEEIADAKALLYGRVHLAGLKVDSFGLYGKELPSTPLPSGQAEDRQRVALADLETYKRAAADPRLRELLGETWGVDFKGYSWDREGDGSSPVYTEAAMLNPNFALLFSFDLDENGYAMTSRARLMMSKDAEVLRNAVTMATDTDTTRH